jgi:hypothetical protein
VQWLLLPFVFHPPRPASSRPRTTTRAGLLLLHWMPCLLNCSTRTKPTKSQRTKVSLTYSMKCCFEIEECSTFGWNKYS